MSFRDYTIGLIGILPGTILFCGFGALAGDLTRFAEVLSDNTNLASSVIRLVGLIATLSVVWLIARAARNVLQDPESSI